MKRIVWRFSIIGLGLVIAFFAVSAVMTQLASQSEETIVDRPKPAMNVLASMLNMKNGYHESYAFLGRVEASQQGDIGFELGGRVSVVLVDEGESVKRGDVLAKLDSTRLEARKAELEAKKKKAAVLLKSSESTYQRLSELAQVSATSQQELDDAQAELDANRASLAETDANIQTIDVEIKQCVLRCPYDAFVVKRWADEGAVVAEGQSVLGLVGRLKPRVRIGLSEDMIETVQIGDVFKIQIGNKNACDGTVTAIAAARTERTRCIDIIVSIDTKLGQVRAGDPAELILSRLVPKRGFWVPLTSLSENAYGVWSIYVVAGGEGNQVTERRCVKTLYQQTDRAYVTGRFADDELIVVGGMHKLVPGQLVRTSVRSLSHSPSDSFAANVP